jgi:molybdopterin-guanine dinucleotide biosynthesis protein A
MGRPKAALIVGGEQLAARTARLLVGVADPVIEIGPGYTNLVRVQEASPGDGPLAAIAAGWAALTGPDTAVLTGPNTAVLTGPDTAVPTGPDAVAPTAALVVATDLPQLTAGLLRLLASSTEPGCVIPVDEAGRPQLLCARYPAGTLARAADLVAHGQRAVLALIDGQEISWLAPAVWQAAAGRADALADVDTPADLACLGGSSRP